MLKEAPKDHSDGLCASLYSSLLKSLGEFRTGSDERARPGNETRSIACEGNASVGCSDSSNLGSKCRKFVLQCLKFYLSKLFSLYIHTAAQ